jgi:cathepsin A (carboxypeptidase C)
MRFLPLVLPFVSAIGSQIPVPSGKNANINTFTVFRSECSHNHSIRVKEQSDTICDARSRQYIAWLDFGTKHLFLWYFESQSDPSEDPLVLWLNGGPGGSGMLAMLQELGPCLINEDGNGTAHSPCGKSHRRPVLTNLSLIFCLKNKRPSASV